MKKTKLPIRQSRLVCGVRRSRVPLSNVGGYIVNHCPDTNIYLAIKQLGGNAESVAVSSREEQSPAICTVEYRPTCSRARINRQSPAANRSRSR